MFIFILVLTYFVCLKSFFLDLTFLGPVHTCTNSHIHTHRVHGTVFNFTNFIITTTIIFFCLDSKKLQRLHSHFQNFVRRKNIPCLSFGETLKTKISKTLPKILLVSTQSSGVSLKSACSLSNTFFLVFLFST